MLTTIRERAQGWIAWVIVIIISVPFALWGINEYFSGQEQVVVAEVNGDEVMLQDFQEVLTRRKASLRQQFGRNIDNKLLESKVFKLRILNEMIGQRLIGEDIRNNNYRISDEQLAAYIRSNENFQQGGRFSQDMYAGALRRNGLSPVAFENSLRNSNTISQITEGFTRSVIVTEAALDDMVRLEQEKRDFAFVNLDIKRFSDKVTVTDAQVKEYYDKNHASYMTPDAVRVEYIVLSIDELAKQVEPDEEALKALYQEQKSQYVTPEQRRAQHILLAVEGDDEAEDARVKALADDLVKQARDGADFAALAKEYSSDTISASKGGDLGFFERGVMQEAFESQAFSMQPGDISDAVRTSYGYHVIKLNEIKPETGKAFADVREEILQAYALREAEAQFGQQAEEMQNLVYEQPTSLQPAAEALGLKVVESDWITGNGGEGITAKQAFIDAAFSEDVLQEGLNSDVIELDENTLVALRNIDHRPPQLKPFDDVAEEIRIQLRDETLQEFAAARVADMVSGLKEGRKSLDEVAAELELSAMTASDVGRVGKDDLAPGLVKAVFSTPARNISGDAAAGSTRVDDHTIVIYSIRKVTPGDPASAVEGVRDQMRTILEQRQGSDMFADYEQGLREKADVTIYEDRL